MYANWMLAPSGYYIAVLEVDNCHIYASGRTVDILEKRIKQNAYLQKKISATQVHLAHEKSESIDLSFASEMFKTKFCKPRKDDDKKIIYTKNSLSVAPTPVYEHITEIDKTTGELVVYKLIEVNRFKLRTIQQEKTETNVVETQESFGEM